MLQRMVDALALDSARADRADDRRAGGARGRRAVSAEEALHRARQHHAAEDEVAHLDLPRLLRQRAVLFLVVPRRTLVAAVGYVHFGVQQQEQRGLRRRLRAQQFLHAERRLDLLHVEERATRAVGLSVHERVRLRGLHLLLEELRLHLRLEYAPSVELEAHTALHALRLLSRRIRLTQLDLT